MNVARGFMTIGPIYLIVGMLIGGYMGASQNHDLMPAHAHINLLGFTLMMIFGIFYHLFPAAASGALARAHFWLHQVGAFVLLVMLILLFTGNISEPSMFPIAPLAELAVLVGTICFAVNVWRHAA